MHTDLSVPIAMIIVALITGLVSFVNLILAKEQKTSEFRQAWIDGLREDLASFFAAARAYTRNTASNKLGYGDIFSEKELNEFRYEVANTFYKIKLRLNPNESEHIKLLELLENAIKMQNQILANQTTDIDAITYFDQATEYARPVLKNEWRRVKNGEIPYRITRNMVAIALLIVTILFGFVIWKQYTLNVKGNDQSTNNQNETTISTTKTNITTINPEKKQPPSQITK